MKSLILFVLVFVFVTLTLSAQVPTLPTPPVPTVSVVPNFSGVLREENGHVNTWFRLDQSMFNRTFILCNRIMDGGYCTQPIRYDANNSYQQDDTGGFSIPIVRDFWQQQVVTLYEIRGGLVEVLATLNTDQSASVGVVVAAYERQMPASNPFQTATTVLKIAGSFDPYAPATVFAGWDRIEVKPTSPRQEQSGGMRESVISIENRILDRLPSTYPLTICQFGMCQTVTVKHIPTGNYSGGKG